MTWITGNQCFRVVITGPSVQVKWKLHADQYGSFEMKCELIFSSRDKAIVLYYPNTSVAISKQNNSLQIKWKICIRKVSLAGCFLKHEVLSKISWIHPAIVLWERQGAFILPSLQSYPVPQSSPTAAVQHKRWKPGRNIISHHGNFCSHDLWGRTLPI